MNQNEQRRYLIDYLLNERRGYEDIGVPEGEAEQRRLLRALMNVRMPEKASEEFLKTQDDYLQARLNERGVTDEKDIQPIKGKMCLWQGDITLLRCDAIVNAANSGLTGCYKPLHSCIDNCIHTYSGVQLRYECDKIIKAQGHEEETGGAKLTPAFNLPSRYVLHTVGPIVGYRLKEEHRQMLISCYESCLKLAAENGLRSIAFCCISTGVFGYPKAEAAKTAVETVEGYLNQNPDSSIQKVIFNVFTSEDKEIYEQLLR